MAPALAGPTPGSRDSSSAGAVFRLTTPSTPLPARARPAGSTQSRARPRMAARRRTPGLSVRPRTRLPVGKFGTLKGSRASELVCGGAEGGMRAGDGREQDAPFDAGGAADVPA